MKVITQKQARFKGRDLPEQTEVEIPKALARLWIDRGIAVLAAQPANIASLRTGESEDNDTKKKSGDQDVATGDNPSAGRAGNTRRSKTAPASR